MKSTTEIKVGALRKANRKSLVELPVLRAMLKERSLPYTVSHSQSADKSTHNILVKNKSTRKAEAVIYLTFEEHERVLSAHIVNKRGKLVAFRHKQGKREDVSSMLRNQSGDIASLSRLIMMNSSLSYTDAVVITTIREDIRALFAEMADALVDRDKKPAVSESKDVKSVETDLSEDSLKPSVNDEEAAQIMCNVKQQHGLIRLHQLRKQARKYFPGVLFQVFRSGSHGFDLRKGGDIVASFSVHPDSTGITLSAQVIAERGKKLRDFGHHYCVGKISVSDLLFGYKGPMTSHTYVATVIYNRISEVFEAMLEHVKAHFDKKPRKVELKTVEVKQRYLPSLSANDILERLARVSGTALIECIIESGDAEVLKHPLFKVIVRFHVVMPDGSKCPVQFEPGKNSTEALDNAHRACVRYMREGCTFSMGSRLFKLDESLREI